MDFTPLQTPSGYTSLATITQLPLESDVNVIGVVVDYMSPIPTRGTDYSCSLFLQDSSLLGSHHNHTGIRIRLFQPPQHMPERIELGDVVMIRGIRWRDISGNKCLVDPRKTAEYLFFASTSIPDTAFKAPHVSEESRAIEHKTLPGKVVTSPGADEQDYIMKLREWAKRHEDHLPQPDRRAFAPKQSLPPRPSPNTTVSGSIMHPLPPRPIGMPVSLRGTSGKFAFLKDVQDGKFHDLAGEVVKMYDSGHVIDLYISDYTFNHLLFDYKENGNTAEDGRDGDPYGYTEAAKPKRKWQGPWGKHTICIGLFEPHAAYARREVNEGDIVRVHNARCFVKEALLQGRLHEDKRHPDQVDIAKLSHQHDLYQAVANQKDEYWQARGNKGKPSGSKGEKKKKKRQKELEEKEAKERAAAILVRTGDQDGANDNPLFVEETRDRLNKKVVAANPDKSFLSLSHIVDTPHRSYQTPQGEEQTLPFVNMKCRSRVRVVDFFPPNLEDFAQDLDDPNYNDMSSSYGDSTMSMNDSSLRSSGWEWAFYLLVEDARPTPGQAAVRMPLLVHGSDAEFLLDLQATDLRYNLEILAQLRRKLWTLWGNVEELKSEGQLTETTKPANHPFECCIAEYGVWDGDEHTGEWKRKHRIFKTTIRD